MTALHTPAQAHDWLRQRVSGQIVCDSREVRPGDGFVAWPGAATDGRRYVANALAAGAAACLVEGEGAQRFGFDDGRIAMYPGLKAATSLIASLWYGQPSAEVDLLAVTGTNGKTSTAWWLAQALQVLGAGTGTGSAARCGLIGTLGVGVPPDLDSTGMTTPDPVRLQRDLRRFADAGIRVCAMEASSIGIAERRLDGTRIPVAIFTNFTRDHLDYHGTMQAYWQAKASLFDWPGLASAVINIDDEHGARLADTLAARAQLDLWTVACNHPARLQARDIHHASTGLEFRVVERGSDHTHLLRSRTIGQYNVSNLLGVVGAMRARGVSLSDAVAACTGLPAVPGRMEFQGGVDQPLVVVDYAHTPDALDQALRALRPLAAARDGQLWCVMGCGGDRDATKRPLMAAVAEKNADAVIVTSDNPRTEKPGQIISQILLGLSHRDAVQVQADRALAIAQAVEAARARDVVLIAGKGHEIYQEIMGVRHPFSDAAHAAQALQRWSATRGRATATAAGEHAEPEARGTVKAQHGQGGHA